MNYINKFINNPDIFNSNNKNQQLLFERALKDLTNYHKNKCSEYANFVKKKLILKEKITISFTVYLFCQFKFLS